MDEESAESPYFNGYWAWDETNDCLQFLNRVPKEIVVRQGGTGSSPPTTPRNTVNNIRFRDTVDNLAQAKFRLRFQRRIKPNEPKVITLQDVKDVAIFTANPKDLTPEFLSYLHTEKMDQFLRTLIVYFQYYFLVWDNLILRREEAKRKLRQPMVTVFENIVRDNLADLRSMVARNYGYIILGLGDIGKFYHMNGTNSLSDKDRQLFEALMCMVARIVWIALQRKYFGLIELEVNRILRSNIFNNKLQKVTTFRTLAEEDRVLLGAAYTLERKLKQRSPAVQELIFDNHEHKMLAIGQLHIEPYDRRLTYLEAAYMVPEEHLKEMNVGVGILGLPRVDFDAILLPKDGVSKITPESKLPEKEQLIDMQVGRTLPKAPCKYQETAQTRRARATQCKMWRQYLKSTIGADVASITSLT